MAVDPGRPASPSPQAGVRPVEDSDEVGPEMRAVARVQQVRGEKRGVRGDLRQTSFPAAGEVHWWSPAPQTRLNEAHGWDAGGPVAMPAGNSE